MTSVILVWLKLGLVNTGAKLKWLKLGRNKYLSDTAVIFERVVNVPVLGLKVQSNHQFFLNHLVPWENYILWVTCMWGFASVWAWCFFWAHAVLSPPKYLCSKRAVLAHVEQNAEAKGRKVHWCFLKTFFFSVTMAYMGICLYNCACSSPRLPRKWAPAKQKAFTGSNN